MPRGGFTPWKADWSDHSKRFHTSLTVRFLTSFSVGMLINRNLECLIDLGRKSGKFMLIPVIFSNLYCVHNRALSPWIPIGTWAQLAGLSVAKGSPNSREWRQNCATSLCDISMPTSFHKYDRIRCGCKMGYFSILMPEATFSFFTGRLMDSISLTDCVGDASHTLLDLYDATHWCSWLAWKLRCVKKTTAENLLLWWGSRLEIYLTQSRWRKSCTTSGCPKLLLNYGPKPKTMFSHKPYGFS